MRVRVLNEQGRDLYCDWLKGRKQGQVPPQCLLADPEFTDDSDFDVDIDLSLLFENRFEFGKYITEKFADVDSRRLLSVNQDGLWDWLVVAYFGQFGRKVSKYWHYYVTRRGHSGSLAYRHLARTAYEMYWRHKENSMVMLHVDMATGGKWQSN